MWFIFYTVGKRKSGGDLVSSKAKRQKQKEQRTTKQLKNAKHVYVPNERE